MKPNPKQIAVARLVSQQASFHCFTNDITSPTHWGDIEQDVESLAQDQLLTAVETDQLQALLSSFRSFLLTLR